MQKICSIFLLIVMLLGLSWPTAAIQVRQLNLTEMTEQAKVVFHGKCISVQRTIDSVTGNKVILATFAVSETLKGDVAKEITIKQFFGKGLGMPGAVSYSVDEEVVLFLYGESELGFSSPVGLLQGKFKVVSGTDYARKGVKTAVNGNENRRLFQGVDFSKLSPQGKQAADQLAKTEKGPVELDAFLQAVKDMVASPTK